MDETFEIFCEPWSHYRERGIDCKMKHALEQSFSRGFFHISDESIVHYGITPTFCGIFLAFSSFLTTFHRLTFSLCSNLSNFSDRNPLIAIYASSVAFLLSYSWGYSILAFRRHHSSMSVYRENSSMHSMCFRLSDLYEDSLTSVSCGKNSGNGHRSDSASLWWWYHFSS